MRVKSISDANAKLGPRAAAQIEAIIQRDNDRAIQAMDNRSKYGNIHTERNGIKFDSKLEADVYDALVAQYGKGGVIRQVSIPLSNGKRIRPDFMIIHSRNDDGTFVASFIDAKGMPTATWTAKANHFEDKYGIKIQLRGKV